MKYLGRDKNIEDSLLDLSRNGLHTNISVMDSDQHTAFSPDQIIVAKSLANKEVMDLVVGTGARHVVQMPNLDFARQVSFSAQILTSPTQFFNDPTKFLLRNGAASLVENPLQHFRYETNSFVNKDEILQKVQTDLDTVPSRSLIRTSALLVADEMLMNALKDAPKYFATTFPHLSAENRGSRLNIAHNDSRLLLWTEDDYGSLNIDKMMRRLQQCYQDDQISPLENKSHGAGLGCRMIFDESVSLSVFVKPGVKTIFCAMLSLGKSNLQNQSLPKNIQILALSF